jgi:signal transduction histidine kinase
VCSSDLTIVADDRSLSLQATDPAPIRDRDITFRHRDGASRSFRLSSLPVYDRDSGELSGFRGTAQDVTELLAHEAALKAAAEAAQAANRTKSEFLANTSHELRTPLNAIIGFTEIMHQEQFGPIGNKRYKTYLSDVLESGYHLLTLINDILDVAKIEAGKLELEESIVDPVELCRQTLRLVFDRTVRHGIQLKDSLPAGLPKLFIDERKVKQVLLNLLSNAIKFTPRDGTVEVAARTDENGDFCFVLRDTGIGIAEDDLVTALMPFGQVDSQLSRRFQGTGLGLPLANAMTMLHGGSLDFESTPGVGTSVTVRLPKERIIVD